MNFPPISSSTPRNNSNANNNTPYTARIPRPPSGDGAYRHMLASYGLANNTNNNNNNTNGTNSSLKRHNSARSARSSRAGSVNQRGRQHSGGSGGGGTGGGSFDGGVDGDEAIPRLGSSARGVVALEASPSPARANSANGVAKGKKNPLGGPSTSPREKAGVYRQNQPVPPPPRSLLTERIVDIDAATAPITSASGYQHLLKKEKDYQASIQFQNDPRQLKAFTTFSSVQHPLSSVPPSANPYRPVSPLRSTSPSRAPNARGDRSQSPSQQQNLRGSSSSSRPAHVSLRGGKDPAPPSSGSSPTSPMEAGAGQERPAESGSLFRPSGRNSVRAALSSGRDCDAIEVAYGVFGPALANLSTAQTLSTLERECHVAQMEGRFVDAQICHDLLNQVANNCADRAQRVVQDKVKKLQPVQTKHEENREELAQFTKLWEKEMSSYDAKGEAVIASLREKQQRQFLEKAQLLESQLASTKPHFSRRVIDLRIELEKLVALKQFREADSIHKDLVALERSERERFEQSLNKKYRKAIKVIVDGQKLELDSLRSRIVSGREELLRQRRADYQTLIQRHAIRVADVDHKVRTQLQQEHKHLEMQAVLMARRPANAVDMFSEYDRGKVGGHHHQHHGSPTKR